ncbi:hypothetical protein CEE44_03670 [Candidatus Woesearchaeota archaeon B3_Woes]|nr:MAG: hypothetical protein CEE44_03670 [Candidatus Woesearchaeota archaeon B3_Woes]
MLSKKQIENLVGSVKKNKKYGFISKELIREEILRYFRINPKSVRFLDHEKSDKFKGIVKSIRAKLHLVYGSFQTKSKDKRKAFLKEIKGKDDYKTHDKILSGSVSSSERLKDYKKLYKDIFKITGNPKKILDLGCGLNPVSYPYMGLDELSYSAYDIDREDCDFLNKYFILMKQYSKLKGKVYVGNLKNSFRKLPKADVCFMFKFLDPLEEKGHKLSEEIIKSLDCKYIIVSFSTKTISGRRMRYPYRGWIEKMLNRINLEFDRFNLENEVFYIIHKS